MDIFIFGFMMFRLFFDIDDGFDDLSVLLLGFLKWIVFVFLDLINKKFFRIKKKLVK